MYGLADEIVSTAAKRSDDVWYAHIPGDHYRNGFRLLFLDLVKNIEARSVRQIDIEKRDRRVLIGKRSHCFRNRSGLDRFVPPGAQRLTQRKSDTRFIIDDKYFYRSVFDHFVGFL